MTSPSRGPWTIVDAATVSSALSWPDAIESIRRALAAGLDPESEPARVDVPLAGGELLMMPAGAPRWAGVKVVSIAPGNPARSRPRIQGVYILFDGPTLTPLAILDGAALTALRTPAVSAFAVDLTAPSDASNLVVFGAGPQALGHVQALRSIRPIQKVAVVGRDPDRTRAFVQRLIADGLDASIAAPTAVAESDLVACCTTAVTPLFDGNLLPVRAVVVACGSHSATVREVDAATAGRGPILIEARSAALAEAGDVIMAMAENACGVDDLVTFADLVTGRSDVRPQLIKTVGMGWEDLVIASAVVESLQGSS